MSFNVFLLFIQVFNADETALIWKKMPSKTFVPPGMNNNIGFKQNKERVSLLVGANASGDYKIKPLLINRAASPRCFKQQVMSDLPVYWASNKRAWMTRDVFKVWLKDHFVPDVTKYLTEKNKEVKILLLLDNASSHSSNDDEICEMFPNLRMEFLPPNTTALIQPMDQGVIANLKRVYLKKTWTQVIILKCYKCTVQYCTTTIHTIIIESCSFSMLLYSNLFY